MSRTKTRDKKTRGQTQVIDKTPQTPEELEQALGLTPPKLEDEGQVEEPKDQQEGGEEKPKGQPTLENILKHLPENVQTGIRKMAEEDQLDIAKEYFKLKYPQGLIAEFRAKLQEVLPEQIQAMADEYMIDLESKRVQVLFPTGGDPIAGVFDPSQEKQGKKGQGFKGEWGECSLEQPDGKVVHYESPSSMARSLGLRITGHNDMVKVFQNPTKAEGKDWETKWVDGRTITLVRGTTDNKADGIHIKIG